MEQVIIAAQIYDDFNGNGYYELNTESGVQYDIRFPIKLATDCFKNIRQIGPEHCNNCREYGSYKGMIISLCGNCIEYVPEEYKCDCNTGSTSQEFNIREQLVEFACDGFMTFGCNSTICIYKTYLKDLPIKTWDELYTDEGKYKFTSTSVSASTSVSSEDDSSTEDLYSVESATDSDADTDTDADTDADTHLDTYKNAKVADINSPRITNNHHIYISSASEDDDEQAEEETEETEEAEEKEEKEEKEEGEISDDEVVYIPPPYITSRSRPRKARLIANELCGIESEEFEQYLDSIYL